MLLYDVTKELMEQGRNPLIIHCGKINDGQWCLINDYKWNIKSIKNIQNRSFLDTLNIGFILIDEAQRIKECQLNILLNYAIDREVPIFFSYDVKQYLHKGEDTNINDFLVKNYKLITVYSYKLTNKIRTNEKMAKFIQNLMSLKNLICQYLTIMYQLNIFITFNLYVHICNI